MFRIRRPLRKILDLTGLLALLLFGLSIWYVMPHPKWTIPLSNPNIKGVGFSADSRTYFTMTDFVSEPNRQLQGPFIQCWDVGTGAIANEFALKIPEEDRKLIDSMNRNISTQVFTIRVLSSVPYFIVGQHEGSNVRIRLFDYHDGKCITQNAIEWPRYFKVSGYDSNGRLLGIGEGDPRGKACAAVLYDLMSGRKVREYAAPGEGFASSFLISPDQKYVLALWNYPKALRVNPYELLVFELDSGKRRFSSELQLEFETGLRDFVGNDLVVSTKKSSPEKRDLTLSVFQIDPSKQMIAPNQLHPIHGAQTENGWFFLGTERLMRAKSHENKTQEGSLRGWLRKVMNRVGLKFPDMTQTGDFCVCQFQTGQKLLELTGVPLQVEHSVPSPAAYYLPCPDGTHIVGIETDQPMKSLGNAPTHCFLTCYAIPHHLWQPTWNFLFYFSLALLLLWPLRFLLRPRRQPATS